MRTSTETTRALVPLTIDECIDLLGSSYLGRLAFVQDDLPHIIPLNYRFADGTVVFRTGYGSLLDVIHNQNVAFEVDGHDEEDHTGWSVVVHGLAEEVWRIDELREIRELPLRPWAPGDRDHYVRILPSAMTGKRITSA